MAQIPLIKKGTDSVDKTGNANSASWLDFWGWTVTDFRKLCVQFCGKAVLSQLKLSTPAFEYLPCESNPLPGCGSSAYSAGKGAMQQGYKRIRQFEQIGKLLPTTLGQGVACKHMGFGNRQTCAQTFRRKAQARSMFVFLNLKQQIHEGILYKQAPTNLRGTAQ